MTSLEDRLLAAHENGDTIALITLYSEAAEQATDATAAGFYLTHAYVFALETGSPLADDLRQRLIDMGREEPFQAATTN
ncbi:MAG: hypothetical protein AAF665_08905 [Pseudomonadota bacterium]